MLCGHMVELIPPQALKTIRTEDGGWAVFDYRGAVIRSKGVHAIFQMSGHPYDGTRLGNLELYQRFVDYWLDHQVLPPGYLLAP